MPPSEPILITGASGFLAAHILNEFLDHGYSIRGTVRSEETAEKVRKTHKKYGDKLSFAIVKDVAAPGKSRTTSEIYSSLQYMVQQRSFKLSTSTTRTSREW